MTQRLSSQTQAVQVYMTTNCPYCVAAKALLDRQGIVYDVIDVSADDEKRRWLVEASGQRTVPQIFVAGRSIGGYSELNALEKAGKLAELLAPPPQSSAVPQ